MKDSQAHPQFDHAIPEDDRGENSVRVEWMTPDFSECSIALDTANNFNGNGSDGKFFS